MLNGGRKSGAVVDKGTAVILFQEAKAILPTSDNRHAHGEEHAQSVRTRTHQLKLRRWVLIDHHANIDCRSLCPGFLPIEASLLHIDAFARSEMAKEKVRERVNT